MAFQGFLKQSTAVDILLGPFLDDTDGKTAEEGLTIEDEHVLLSKNGQGLAAKNDANNAAHDAGGYYNCPLDTTDTNTVGQLTITCHMTGALPVRLDYHIVEEAVYDAMYGGSAAGPLQSTTAARKLDVNANGEAGLDFDNTSGTLDAAQFGGDFITSDKIADDAITNDHLATGAISSDTLAADCITEAKIADDAIGDEHIDASFMGTDSKILVSTDAQDLSGTLDVNTKTLTDGAITAGKLGADCITSDKIADDAIANEHLATGAISADTLAADCITEAKIADDAIAAEHIAAGAIVAATFAADVDAEILSYIVDDATRIDASELNTLSGHDPGDTIGTSTLTQAQVTGGAYALDTDANGRIRIVDGTGAGELDTASGKVSLADGSITAAVIGTGAIDADALAADCITEAKIADDAFSTEHFADISELSQGAPSSTPSLPNAVMAMYMALRNQLITSTSGENSYLEIYNDAGTCVFKKELNDDGDDYTESKAESGA